MKGIIKKKLKSKTLSFRFYIMNFIHVPFIHVLILIAVFFFCSILYFTIGELSVLANMCDRAVKKIKMHTDLFLSQIFFYPCTFLFV